MGSNILGVTLVAVCLLSIQNVDAMISKSMYISWGKQHASISGEDLKLVLDQTSGSAAQSKRNFLFGSIEMLIKLVPGNSAGTVTAYYLSSKGDKHDEIDFEFLGNVSGQPYIIHTNIYCEGKGNREQQFYPWFDPTSDFHNYTIHWNSNHVVWYVDGLPIRVFKNYEKEGVGFPSKQGMRVHTSLWNGDDWATRGGRDKVDWAKSPFTAAFTRFRARACKWDTPANTAACSSSAPANWWARPFYASLSDSNKGRLNWVRSKYMIYDYCKDTKRFNNQMPLECSKP